MTALAKYLALALALATMSSGCSLTFDLAYSLGDKKFSETLTESDATDHEVDRQEYDLTTQTDGSTSLACFQRKRWIERRVQVTKDYEYRGGYEPDTYRAVALADVMLTVLAGGIMTAACLGEDSHFSCQNLWFVSPAAVSSGYGLIRSYTTDEPVLVDKRRARHSTFGVSAVPHQEEQTSCESLVDVVLAASAGFPEGIDGSDPQFANLRALKGEPLTVGIIEGQLALNASHAEAWLRDQNQGLFARDSQGYAHALTFDGCTSFRDIIMREAPHLGADFSHRCNPQPPASQ